MAIKLGAKVAVRNLKGRRDAAGQRDTAVFTWSAPADTTVKDKWRSEQGKSSATHTKSALDGYQYRVEKDKITYDKARKKYVVAHEKGGWRDLDKYTRFVEVDVDDGETGIRVWVRPKPKSYEYYKTADKKCKKSTGKLFAASEQSAIVNTGAFHVPEMPEIASVEVLEDGVTIEVTLKDSDPYTASFQAQASESTKFGSTLNRASSLRTDTVTYAKEAVLHIAGQPSKRYYIRGRMQNVLAMQDKRIAGSWAAARPDYTSLWAYWKNASDDWNSVVTKPARCGKPWAKGGEAVTVEWGAVPLADSYEIAYAQRADAFEASSGYQTKDTTGTRMVFDDLEPGSWFFWVRAANASGEGDWSAASDEIRTGKRPTAPTTWASKYVGVRGDDIEISWQHNSADGSEQADAELWLSANGSAFARIGNLGTATSYTLKTGQYPNGADVSWYVHTWGCMGGGEGKSPASETRCLKVWDRPSPVLELPDTATFYPIAGRATATASGQVPVSVTVRLLAAEPYESTLVDGTRVSVAEGDEVLRLDLDPDEPMFDVAVGDCVLADGVAYTAELRGVMSSGLPFEASRPMLFDVEPASYTLYAEIDQADGWAVTITPSACEWGREDDDQTDEESETADIDIEGDAEEVPYAENVVLSIYRHETDGTLTLLARNIPNDGLHGHVDRHAMLKRQAYRIAAFDTRTGLADYLDVTSELNRFNGLVIEWGASDPSLEYVRDPETGLLQEQSGDGGTVLDLPWSVDVSEGGDSDRDLLKPFGLAHPRARYGTHQNAEESWNTRIRESDSDRLAKLRSLRAHRGDAFVRQPLGSGYWAAVSPHWSRSGQGGVIDVDIDAVRTATVDGHEDYARREP